MFFEIDRLIREFKEQLTRIEHRLVEIEMVLREANIYVDTIDS